MADSVASGIVTSEVRDDEGSCTFDSLLEGGVPTSGREGLETPLTIKTAKIPAIKVLMKSKCLFCLLSQPRDRRTTPIIKVVERATTTISFTSSAYSK